MRISFFTLIIAYNLLAFQPQTAHAQSTASPKSAEMSVFLEMFGMNKYASCNADIALSRFVYMRLGAGYIGVPFGLAVVLPFGESFNGRSNKNLELSFGFALPVFESLDATTGNITAAYRHFPTDGGLTYRVGITFLFETEETTREVWRTGWFGIPYQVQESKSTTTMQLLPALSVGYAF